MAKNGDNVDREVAGDLLKSSAEPRDRLPYTPEFDRLHGIYCQRAGSVSKQHLMQAFFNLAKDPNPHYHI